MKANMASDEPLVCLHCGEALRQGLVSDVSQTFLGFRKYSCAACGGSSEYPLRRSRLVAYWTILFLVTPAALAGLAFIFISILHGDSPPALAIVSFLFFLSAVVAGILVIRRNRRVAKAARALGE